jgi:hypothetical protein
VVRPALVNEWFSYDATQWAAVRTQRFERRELEHQLPIIGIPLFSGLMASPLTIACVVWPIGASEASSPSVAVSAAQPTRKSEANSGSRVREVIEFPFLCLSKSKA